MLTVGCLRSPFLSDVVDLGAELLDLVVPVKTHKLVESLVLLLVGALRSPLSLFRHL